MRDVGELGESTLKLWASQASIIANKSIQDKTGWDYFLEWPVSRDTTNGVARPLDKDPFPLTAFVQVKASDKRPGKWPVKLDNWERAVKNPLPVFFLVLEFDSLETCQRAYLVHVGGEYIRHVLKKLRETAFSEQSPLHKRTMQFAYSEKDALPSLDGWGLEQAMRRYVEGSMEEYAKKKLDLVKTVGYEDGYAIFDITMSLPPTYGTNIQEYLVDLSLGLVPHLEITHGQIKDYRFRIPAPEPSKVLGKGTLAFFNQPKGKATLRLSTPDGKRQLALEPDVYFPEGISPEIMEPDLRKVRLALPFFNIVIWPDKRATFQFTQLDITEEYDIHSLQTLANLTLFLHEAMQRYTHVNFQVNVKSLKVGFGQMEVSQLFDVDTIRFIATIDDGMKIAKYFDLPQDTKLKPAELWQQRDQLLLMTVATGLKQGVLRLSFWMEDTITDKEKERCIPFVTIVTLGPYRVVIAAAILGRLEPKDEFREKHREVEIIVNRIEVCRTYRYDREETDVPSVRELIESVTHDFEDSHDIVLLEEFVH